MNHASLLVILFCVAESAASSQRLRTLYWPIFYQRADGICATSLPVDCAMSMELHGKERVKELTIKKWVGGNWVRFDHKVEVYDDRMDRVLYETEVEDSLGQTAHYLNKYAYNDQHVMTAWSSAKKADTGWQEIPIHASAIVNDYRDSNGNQNTIHHVWNSTGTVEAYQYSRSKTKTSVREMSQKYDGNTWVIQTQRDLEMDSLGRTLRETVTDFVADTSFDRFTTQDNGSGLTVTSTNPGYSRELWTYDANRSITDYRKLTWKDRAWVLTSVVAYEYEGGAQKRAEGWEIADLSSDREDTVRFRSDFFGVRGSEPETTIISYQDARRGWQYAHRILVDSNSVSKTKTTWTSLWQGNQWVNVQRLEQHFDERQRETGMKIDDYQNGHWELNQATEKKYGDQGTLVLDEHQERVDGVLSGTRNRYVYDTLGRVSEIWVDSMKRGEYGPSLYYRFSFADEKAHLTDAAPTRPPSQVREEMHDVKPASRQKQVRGRCGDRPRTFPSEGGWVNALGRLQ